MVNSGSLLMLLVGVVIGLFIANLPQSTQDQLVDYDNLKIGPEVQEGIDPKLQAEFEKRFYGEE